MTNEIRMAGPYLKYPGSMDKTTMAFRFNAVTQTGGEKVQHCVEFISRGPDDDGLGYLQPAINILRTKGNLIPWPYGLPPAPECPFALYDAGGER